MMMTKRTGYLAVILAALLAAAMPLSAGAQAPGQKGAPSKAAHSKGGGGGGGGKPAARATPHRAAAPRRAPQRASAPRYKAPTVQKHRIKRAQSHKQAKPASKAARQKPQLRQQNVQQQQKRAQQRHYKKRSQPSTAATQQQQQQIQQRANTRQGGTRNRRARQHQQTQPNAAARVGAPTAPNALTRRARHGNRAGPASAQAARRGRFASAYGAPAQVNGNRRAWRNHYEARRAWRHGLRAPFVPWYGPVFWPYAYSDIFDYTFWPYGYEPGFWAYTYDGFIDSLFWGERGPPGEYVEYAAPPPRPSYRSVERLCKQPGSGITAWPFAEITRKVHLDDEQKHLLAEVRAAAKQAAGVFKASCPSENAFPMTPPGRLRTMMARLDATLEAVQTVRPALARFYDSLSDEQKERFNRIGPKGRKSPEANQASPSSAQACATAKPGLTNLPIDHIDDVVKPNDVQQHALDRLGEATVKAVSILQAACPQDTPLTPPGRLEVMETRLQAMLDAANTVKPALDEFYGSLSSEQKARFNRIGRDLAESKS